VSHQQERMSCSHYEKRGVDERPRTWLRERRSSSRKQMQPQEARKKRGSVHGVEKKRQVDGHAPRPGRNQATVSPATSEACTTGDDISDVQEENTRFVRPRRGGEEKKEPAAERDKVMRESVRLGLLVCSEKKKKNSWERRSAPFAGKGGNYDVLSTTTILSAGSRARRNGSTRERSAGFPVFICWKALNLGGRKATRRFIRLVRKGRTLEKPTAAEKNRGRNGRRHHREEKRKKAFFVTARSTNGSRCNKKKEKTGSSRAD